MEEIEENDRDGYSGTFRWKKSKRLPSLPVTHSTLADDVDHLRESLKGWMQYLVSRCETVSECNSLVQYAQQDMSLIDCLSSPISVGYALTELGIFPHISSENLNIVCIGCSAKCEERILFNTNAWEELLRFVGPDSALKVWLIGPEVSHTKETLTKGTTEDENRLRFGIFRGTCMEFFRTWPTFLSSNIVIIGLNCGFGNWENPISVRYNLLFNWLPDLYFLTGTKIPLVFTCANDFADVAGESGVMHRILGAKFIMQPQANPFGFASTLIPPGVKPEDASKLYTRGNSFVYAVQGYDRARRVKLNTNNADTRAMEFISLYNRVLQHNPPADSDINALVTVPIMWPPEALQKKENSEKPMACATSKVDTVNLSASDVDSNSTTIDEELGTSSGKTETSMTLGECLKIVQRIDCSNSKILSIVITISADESRFGPNDVDISYSQSTGEFFVSANNGRIAKKFEALRPVEQSSITAKANRKLKKLTITASLI